MTKNSRIFLQIALLTLLLLLVSCGSEPAPETPAKTEVSLPVYSTLTVAGNPVSTYKILYGPWVDPDSAVNFVSFLTNTFGLTEGDGGIVFDLSVSLQMAGQASLVVDGNTVFLTAGSGSGLNTVLNRLMEKYYALPTPEGLAALESFVETEYTYTLFESNDPAQSYTLTGYTDRDPTSYRIGEVISIRFELTCDGELVPCTELRYSIVTDDGYKKTGTVPGEDGKFYYTHTLTKPGYIKVKISARGDKAGEGNTGYFKGTLCERSITACANFEEIGTAFEEPKDFDSFWEQVLAKLDKVDLTDTEITEYLPGSEYGRDGYRVYHVMVPTDKDPAVGFITVPENAAPGSLPIHMHFIGYGSGQAGPTTNPDAISFCVCAHSIRCNVKSAHFDREFERKGLHEYALKRSDYANPYNAYFTGMISRNVQALRFAETFPEWDGKNVTATGASQGAFQSIALAALCPEVSGLNLDIPWMCNVGVNAAGQIPCDLTPEFTKNVLYFDSVFFARRINGIPVTIRVGMTDNLAPITGTTALFNNLKGCDRTATFYQSIGHGGWKANSEAYVKEASAESAE